MYCLHRILFLSTLLSYVGAVLGLGTACSAPLGVGKAGPTDPFWMQNIKHQGISAYHSDPARYQVFRNIKDFGAKGDGVTDDTAAINNAISSGGRCGASCGSTTITPAAVFFPQGTYVVSSPIIVYYYTQLIGDARNPPTLLASSSFSGIAVIDVDPYIPNGGGAQWYVNQDNFYRSVRNFVVDVRQVPASSTAGTGIHWQVSQSASLMNIVFQMSTAPNTAHQGIWMENGSGGFMGDLVFNGGKYGMWVGNQQFTVRNVTVNNAQSAIYMNWNWGWTFQTVNISNCQVGFDLATGGVRGGTQTAGAMAIIDATVTNTGVFVRTSTTSPSTPPGSIVINNAKLTNTPVAVGVTNREVVLAGGTTTIPSWGQGNVYSGSSPLGSYVQGDIIAVDKPSVLLDGAGKIFGKGHPQYADYAVSQFVSVRSNGAKGDGVTDDTTALAGILNQYAGCAIIFFDAGTYVVTSTLTIPAGTRIVGEAWSVIAGTGSFFQNVNSPQPVVRVGAPNSQGVVEISDIIFTTIGPTPGAIVVEWNVAQPWGHNGGAGMWDSHIRLGGAAGTKMQISECPSSGSGGIDSCTAAFLGLHLTPRSTAYLEGTWVWLADHDLDAPGSAQLTVYSGRGILSESAGPVWMIGTAEHHVLYQYSLVNARNHYLGLIQTESPYYQPSPAPPFPFSSVSRYHDPTSDGLDHSWGLWVQSSSDIIVFGGGLYSWYDNYDQTCLTSQDCQSQIANVDSASRVGIYSLSTVATTYQLSVDWVGVINQSGNAVGYASTVTAWHSSR